MLSRPMFQHAAIGCRKPGRRARGAGVVRAGLGVACLSVIGSFTAQTHAITLADAAALPAGSVVTIDEALVINSTRMTINGDNLIQLRDDTRAVSVFAASGGVDIDTFLAGAVTGDVISFTATTLSYGGQFELTAMTGPAVTLNSPAIGTSLDPVPVTPADFNDLSPTAEGLESRYVALQGVELFYGGYALTQPPIVGRPVAGELFQMHTTYVARDAEGHEATIWARSQASVDSLNAYFGTIPAGYFDLPGIFLQAFGSDTVPNVTGTNYLLSPVIVSIPGDLNMDGFVGIGDLNIVLGNWNQAVTAGSSPSGDPSGDGFVGIADLNTVLGHWNTGTPPPTGLSAPAPEPGTLALIGLAGAGLLRRNAL